MNFLQLVQRLHSESGRSTVAPVSVATASPAARRLFDAIADANREIEQEDKRRWRWKRRSLAVDLTTGKDRYTAAELGIAETFGRWRPEDDSYSPRCAPVGSATAVWDVDFVPLDWFKRQYIDIANAPSTPIAWTIDNDETLWLAPAPAQPYGLRIDYITKTQELAADGDVPALPERFHMLLVWRALMDVATADAAPEVMQRAARNHGALRQQLLIDQGSTVVL